MSAPTNMVTVAIADKLASASAQFNADQDLVELERSLRMLWNLVRGALRPPGFSPPPVVPAPPSS